MLPLQGREAIHRLHRSPRRGRGPRGEEERLRVLRLPLAVLDGALVGVGRLGPAVAHPDERLAAHEPHVARQLARLLQLRVLDDAVGGDHGVARLPRGREPPRLREHLLVREVLEVVAPLRGQRLERLLLQLLRRPRALPAGRLPEHPPREAHGLLGVRLLRVVQEGGGEAQGDRRPLGAVLVAGEVGAEAPGRGLEVVLAEVRVGHRQVHRARERRILAHATRVRDGCVELPDAHPPLGGLEPGRVRERPPGRRRLLERLRRAARIPGEGAEPPELVEPRAPILRGRRGSTGRGERRRERLDGPAVRLVVGLRLHRGEARIVEHERDARGIDAVRVDRGRRRRRGRSGRDERGRRRLRGGRGVARGGADPACSRARWRR